jgi:hypothetical protein
MTTLDQIGAEAARLLKEAKEKNETALTKASTLLEERQAKIKPLLEQVWTALNNKQTVNGCATKGAWAKSIGYTTRALQYIIYGRPEKKKDEDCGANTRSQVANLDKATHVIFGGIKYPLNKLALDANTVFVTVVLDQRGGIINANKIEDLIQHHPVP